MHLSPEKITLAITLGDPNGIGPEVVAKALGDAEWPEGVQAFLLGDPAEISRQVHITGPEAVLPRIASRQRSPDGGFSIWESPSSMNYNRNPGTVDATAGRIAMEAVTEAVHRCQTGSMDGMVTAPISKDAVVEAGYPATGHTEFIAGILGTERYIMMLVSDALRVAVATTHIPVRAIAEQVNFTVVREKLEILNGSLKNDFLLPSPRIAVLGLNPHAGDGGKIGDEEMVWLRPCIESAKRDGIQVEGPMPADGFFGSRMFARFDAVLAMYHDQGLVPFKTLAFNKGVNFTAGLPIIRTSPDHGTAFDIVDRNLANPGSFLDAVHLAARLARIRIDRKMRDA